MESSFICMDHSSFYPRPGLETDMGITCIFLSVYFISQVYLPLKMKIWCLPSLQEDWQIVPFIYCCCGVMRHALYFWRLSKKLFTSQYIQNRSHLGFWGLFYLFLALLGLHCCRQAFSSCGKSGCSPVVVFGFLIAVASLVAEHCLGCTGFSSCGVRA